MDVQGVPLFVEVIDTSHKIGERVDVILMFPPVELVHPMIFGTDEPFVGHAVSPAM